MEAAGEGGRDIVGDGEHHAELTSSILAEGIYFDLGSWRDCQVLQTKFTDCYWFGSIFDGGEFSDCRFEGCIFYGVSFWDLMFSGNEFINCSFHGLGFFQVKFKRNRLLNVYFACDNLHSECRFEDFDAAENKVHHVAGFPSSP